MLLRENHPRFHAMIQEHGTMSEKIDYFNILVLLDTASIFNAPLVLAKEIERLELKGIEDLGIYQEIFGLVARDNFWFIDETFELPYYI